MYPLMGTLEPTAILTDGSYSSTEVSDFVGMTQIEAGLVDLMERSAYPFVFHTPLPTKLTKQSFIRRGWEMISTSMSSL